MPEPDAYDLWLLRAQREDQTPADQEASRRACIAALGALLRVDANGAQQILSQLPRLIARNVRASSAHKLLEQLSRTGAIAHLCPVGQTPRFDELAKKPPRAAAPARNAPNERGRKAKATDALVDAARAAHDAATAHFPDADGPIDFSPRSSGDPPPVPRPIRHSAGRVAALLVSSVTLLGAGGALYWVNVAQQELRLAESSSAPPPGEHAPARAASASAVPVSAARTAALIALAEHAKQPAFAQLAAQLGSAVEHEPEPLRIDGVIVGATLDVRTTSTHAQLDALQDVAARAGALLFVHERDVQVGFDRLALVPTHDAASLAEALGTSGPGATPAEVAAWLRALRSERPYRLVALARHFAEGRFESPTRDEETLANAVYDCPGETLASAASSAASATAQSVGVLDSKHRGERFTCAWPAR